MALEIEHINDSEVRGTLDGGYEFHVEATPHGIVARIHDWSRNTADRTISTANEMRSLAYEMLARFREDQRAQSV